MKLLLKLLPSLVAALLMFSHTFCDHHSATPEPDACACVCHVSDVTKESLPVMARPDSAIRFTLIDEHYVQRIALDDIERPPTGS